MKILRTIAAAAVAALLLTGGPALADEKFLGTVTKITLLGDKAATVVLQAEDGKTIELLVDDQITLEKFKDRRISPGDEIKAKYEVVGGKKHATYFKKPAGC